VPRSWLTTQDGEQQQDKRAEPYKPVLEDYVLDIPFNDYAFYPGTLFYPDEGICWIVPQHPVHFLVVSLIRWRRVQCRTTAAENHSHHLVARGTFARDAQDAQAGLRHEPHHFTNPTR
jgi:hypothetical protein